MNGRTDWAKSKLATCMKRVQVDGTMFGRVGKVECAMASKFLVSGVEDKSGTRYARRQHAKTLFFLNLLFYFYVFVGFSKCLSGFF